MVKNNMYKGLLIACCISVGAHAAQAEQSPLSPERQAEAKKTAQILFDQWKKNGVPAIQQPQAPAASGQSATPSVAVPVTTAHEWAGEYGAPSNQDLSAYLDLANGFYPELYETGEQAGNPTPADNNDHPLVRYAKDLVAAGKNMPSANYVKAGKTLLGAFGLYVAYKTLKYGWNAYKGTKKAAVTSPIEPVVVDEPVVVTSEPVVTIAPVVVASVATPAVAVKKANVAKRTKRAQKTRSTLKHGGYRSKTIKRLQKRGKKRHLRRPRR